MMGDILLYEADTGILKALLDAEYITTLRTGAVAAHSAFQFICSGGDFWINRSWQYNDHLFHNAS